MITAASPAGTPNLRPLAGAGAFPRLAVVRPRAGKVTFRLMLDDLERHYGEYAQSLLWHVKDPSERESTARAHLAFAFTILQQLQLAALEIEPGAEQAPIVGSDPFDYDHVFRQLLQEVARRERPSRLEHAGHDESGGHDAGQSSVVEAKQEWELFVKNLQESADYFEYEAKPKAPGRATYLRAMVSYVINEYPARSLDDLDGDRNPGRTEYICRELGESAGWENNNFWEVKFHLHPDGTLRNPNQPLPEDENDDH